jgi:hypothetical protein
MMKTIFSKTSSFEAGRLSRVGSLKDLSLKLYFPWVRLLIWALQLDKAPFMEFAVRIRRIWVCNGPEFLVHYTKEAVRIVQHFVSGNPVSVTTEIPISIVRGIPSIVPGSLRLQMHSGDPRVIRGVLTLLSVYRIIKFPGTTKLETITAPFSGLSRTLPIYELLAIKDSLPCMGDLSDIVLKFSRAAGPNCKVAGLGIWKDIKAWSLHPLQFSKLKSFIDYFPNGLRFNELLQEEAKNLVTLSPNSRLSLGRLSFKEEPAGKVRVFAIADSITQSVMDPLSRAIFSLLRQVPQDGTFNQSAPLELLRRRWLDGSFKGETIYSYDLSAATDRLPVDLQSQILGVYFGNDFSDLWQSIMTDRDWIAKVVTIPGLPAEEEPYRYSVGQPMGALSSWGMLALTHHYVVRLASRRVGLPAFEDYAILGDDVVIANKSVALAYHSIMVEILGVSINASKSLISEHSFEFAKRLITKGVEVSPLGPANLLVAVRSLNGISSVLWDAVQKGLVLTEETVDVLLKSVPTVRKSQLDRILWTIKGPFGFVPTAEGLASFLTMSSSLTPVRANQIIDAVRRVKHSWDCRVWDQAVRQAIEFQVSICELYYPVGFEGYPSDFRFSPIREELRKQISEDLISLGSSRPRWRLIFGGPLIMTNYYRAGYQSEIVAYLKTLIIDKSSEVSILGGDPFVETSFERFAFSSSFKGQKFFEEVRETLRSREVR